ncbi:amino acid adenylation domain-containing protein [Parapedobacter deserti]|uniref:Amino acid adenylation domain-containing protein n=1 Tax=Parapedobacter deserti TaxID=1912957 RepID=A0ABV7JDG0_9SPHI
MEQKKYTTIAVDFDPFAQGEIEKTVRLTESQEEIWMACVIGGAEASCAYNESISLVLRGSIRMEALSRALQDVVTGHESLRSTFSANGKSLCIHTASRVSIRHDDLSALDREAQDKALADYGVKDAETPFDLQNGPLFRAAVFRLTDEKCLVRMTAHHLVCDGWSFGIILEDLAALYSAYVQDSVPQIERPVGFGEYVRYLTEFSASDACRQTEAYWAKQFEQPPPQLEIPVDFPRPSVRTYKSDHADLTLDAKFVEDLQLTGKKYGCSLVTVLLTAFETYMHRLTSQEDLVLGLATAGQSASGYTNLVGHCVNLLPIRSRPSGEQRYEDYLRMRKGEIMDAFDHQQLTLGKLLKSMKIARDASRVALTPIVFNVDINMGEHLSFYGLQHELLFNPRRYENFEIFLNISRSHSSLILEWSYNRQLFTAATIKRMMTEFECLLQSIAEHPEQRIAELNILPKAQLDQLNTWNETTHDFGNGTTFLELFSRAVKKYSENIAVKFNDRYLTFGETEKQSNQFAHALIEAGLKEGDKIGVALDRSEHLIIALIGIMKTGATYLPFEVNHPPARVSGILEEVNADFLLTATNYHGRYQHNGQTIYIEQLLNRSAHLSANKPALEVNGDDLIYILHTSGSTGTPKGVQISHKNVANFLKSMELCPGISDKDRVLAITPVSFDMAVLLYLPLVSGGELVLADMDTSKDGRLLHELLIKEQISWMIATPSTWEMIISAGWNTPLDLLAISAGEALTPRLAKLLLERCTSLWNGYGPTETTVMILMKQIESHHQPITLGKPLANTEIYILDRYGNRVPIGHHGEIHIAGANVGMGYYDRADLTHSAFIANPFSAEEGKRMYRSGDLGRFTENGDIEYLGRIDNQVKIRGHRIELGEIEYTLAAQHGIKDAVVLAVDDHKGDKTLVAYVVQDAEDATGWKDRWEDLYELGIKSEEDVPLEQQNLDMAIISQYYTSGEIEEQGAEWTNEGLKRIRALNPKKIVELGTGGGHLLFALGSDVAEYIATDYSEVAITKLKEKLALHPEKWQHVHAYTAMADDFTGIKSEAYDLVFMHGVAQYFPSLQYLQKVIKNATSALKDGGCLYIGDMQTLGAISMHFYLDQLGITNDQTTLAEFKEITKLRIQKEEELSVDPEFFYNLPAIIPEITSVDVQIRGGNYLNEGTKCHYDIWLYVGDTAPKAATPDIDLEWGTSSDSAWLRQQLNGHPGRIVRISQIPNSRLSRDFALLQLINLSENHTQIRTLKERMLAIPSSGFNPSDLWNIGEQMGYATHVRWSSDGSDGCVEAVFIPEGLGVLPGKPEVSETKSVMIPTREVKEEVQILSLPEHQIKRWKDALRSSLPDYMVPMFYIALSRFPLSTNGKIDRALLPQPTLFSRDTAAEDYRAPSTETERLLHKIWTEFLAVDNISVNSNFFELGGHSLIAVKVMLMIERELAKRLPITSLFEHSTIEKLAHLIDAEKEGHDQGIGQQPVDASATCAHPVVYVIPTIEPQREIWLACEMGGDEANNGYTITFTQELSGPLQPDALHKAAQQLVNRHEALRANFSDDGNELIIKSYADVDWTLQDISGMSGNEKSTFIEKQAEKEASRIFDLRNDALFSVSLYRLEDERHYLFLTTHHIIFDGWSYNAAMTELGALYSAFVTNTTPEVPPAPEFSTYAVKEHEYYQSSAHEAAVKYWLSRLQGELVPLQLPTDNLRPQKRTYGSKRASFPLPAKALQVLKQISIKENCSVSMVLRSILDVFLYRMTGQADIITGMPVAGQLATNQDNLIGHCVNMLPVRSHIDGNTPFSNYLRLRKTQLLDDFSNQRVTFGTLLQSLNIPRDKSRPALISVVMNTGHWLDNGTTLFHGLRNELKDSPKFFENFELVLDIIEYADSMRVRWDYNSTLFNAETIEAFHERFEYIITQLSANEDTKIDRISLLLPSERDSNTAFPRDVNDDCLAKLLKDAVDRHANKPAILSANEKVTYKELDLRSNRFANALAKNGVGSGDTVGIAMNRSIDTITAVMGVIKTGAAYLPLDLRHPQERIDQIVSGASLKFVITEEHSPFAFPTVNTRLTVGSLLNQTYAIDTSPPDIPLKTDRIIYILYTSGSTGVPKGVCMGHRALVNLLKWQMEASAANADFNTLQFSPLSFDVSFQEIFSTLVTGGTLSLISDEARVDPSQLLQHIQKNRVNRLFLPFVALQSLADYAMTFNEIPSQLKEVITAGEQLIITPKIASFFKSTGATLFNQYGPTETHVVTQFRLPDAPDNWPALPPIGESISNTRIFILNEQLVEEPVGVVGELCVAGAALADGYLNAPSETAARFKLFRPSASDPGVRIYKTGDLARRMPDGKIEFIGRKDSQVKFRGFRIELGEIEHALIKQPEIREAVVMLRENTDNKQLTAYLVLQPGSVFERQQTIAQLKAELPDYMVPTAWAIVPAVPLTKSGKVDRKALEASVQPVETPSADDNAVVHSETQKKLVTLWSNCLGVENIGIRDDFFELGGHSLIAVKLMSQIHQNFGIKLPLGSLFENSTIEQQAKLIDEKQDPMKWDCVIPLRKEGRKPPLYIIHGALLDVLYVGNLLRHLDPDQPLYGIQGMGLSGKSKPHRTVEKIAGYYVKEILKYTPDGPLAIAGYSSGGIIAFEIAKQLRARGIQVSFFGLLDSYVNHAQFSGLREWLRHDRHLSSHFLKGVKFKNRIKLTFAAIMEMVATVYLSRISYRLYRVMNPSRNKLTKLQLLHKHAVRRYKLAPYDLDAYLFKSPFVEAFRYYPHYNTNGWGPIFGKNLKIVPIEETHSNMFYPDKVFDLGSKLQAALNETWEHYRRESEHTKTESVAYELS